MMYRQVRLALQTGRHFSTKYKPLPLKIKNAYRTLELDESVTSQEEIKTAYLRQAKLYHPDSRSDERRTEDPDRSKEFSAIQKAFEDIKEHLRHGESILEEIEEDDEYVIPKQAHHREYLEYGGKGTISERMQQTAKRRFVNAVERTNEFKVRKEMPAQDRDALVSKKHKVTQAIDRLVEDMIQQSMQQGDFDNLKGAGKPLADRKENPYVDSTTQKLNQVFINNGFAPEWIELQKEMREHEAYIMEVVLKHWREGVIGANEEDFKGQMEHVLQEEVKALNKMIDKYNILVPMLHAQKMHFSLSRKFRTFKLPERTSVASKKTHSNSGASTNTPGIMEMLSDIFAPKK